MTAAGAAEQLSTGGADAVQHPDWHGGDAAAKAADLRPAIEELLFRTPGMELRLADAAAGTGGVLHEVVRVAQGIDAELKIDPAGFETSRQAVDMARQLYPGLAMQCKPLEAADGPFDAVLLVNVLEHLENPWEMLRTAHETCRFLLVRQPLLGGFSGFRQNRYAYQRKRWGHIGMFTSRSLLDMTAAAGWSPRHVEVAAPWELAGFTGRAGSVQRVLCGWDRETASFFLSGFCLNGLFERA